MSASLHVLILAAGGSSRLGQPKQLVRLGDRPALHRVMANAVALANHSLTVVLGAHASRITPMFTHSAASFLINRQWEEGMASSIRCGIAALPPACDAVMILLGDQVAVSVDDLKRLVAAWREQDGVIAAAAYERHVGVPAIFPRLCFSELQDLRGDQGARLILQRHQFRVSRVPMSSASVDLDTPEDLAALSQRFSATIQSDDPT